MDFFLTILRKKDPQFDENIIRACFRPVVIYSNSVLSAVKTMSLQYNSIMSEILYTFQQISSDDILYSSVVFQRVLIGLLLAAAVVYFLRSIASDISLQKQLSIGRVSLVLTENSKEKLGFLKVYEALSGECADKNKSQKESSKSDSVNGKFSDKISDYIIDDSFIEKVVQKMSGK